jgi:hypothetical protein
MKIAEAAGDAVAVMMEVVESSVGGKVHTTRKPFYGKVTKVNLTRFAVPKFQVKWEDSRESNSWFPCGDADVTLNPAREGLRPSPSAGPPTSVRQTRARGKRGGRGAHHHHHPRPRRCPSSDHP